MPVESKMASGRFLIERRFETGRSESPGKPSKIGKRVKLSICALSEANDSRKAAEKRYLGLPHFNGTFGNEMAAPSPFLGFTLWEVEEAMVEARIQQREAEAEHKKQGIKLDLYEDFRNELFSMSNCKRTDVTNGEANKRKLFDGNRSSSKDKLASSNDNGDNKACSSGILNLESLKKYNSLKKKSDSVTTARKLLKRAKSDNLNRKFVNLT